MNEIAVGSRGLKVSTIGLGCMGMTPMGGGDIYGKADEAQAVTTIHRFLELGGKMLDTADAYGPFLNEQLIAKAIQGRREQVILATKFGGEIDDQGQWTGAFNGSKTYIKKAVERSLKNLRTDYIDLYYQHRQDKRTPVEESVEAMSELVQEGKVRYIGLSEVSSQTIRRAHAIYPLTAVQMEYSLFERTVEQSDVKATLDQLGIGLVAYSPVGRGFLSGQFKKAADFSQGDFRGSYPKFTGEQLAKNVHLLEEVERMADEKGITAIQLALAWVVVQGAVPIPGTKRVQYVEENMAAGLVELSTADLSRLEQIIPLDTITGDRYDPMGMESVEVK